MSEPMSDKRLDEIRETVRFFDYGENDADTDAIIDLLAEVDRLRAEKAAMTEYCYVCGLALTPATQRYALIDGGRTIVHICGHADCADDERINSILESADVERWQSERRIMDLRIDLNSPDSDLD